MGPVESACWRNVLECFVMDFLRTPTLIDGYKRQLLGRNGGCLRRRNRHSEGTWQSWSWPDMSSEVSLSNDSAYNSLRQFLPQATSS